jgi:hypothetical protein
VGKEYIHMLISSWLDNQLGKDLEIKSANAQTKKNGFGDSFATLQ